MHSFWFDLTACVMLRANIGKWVVPLYAEAVQNEDFKPDCGIMFLRRHCIMQPNTMRRKYNRKQKTLIAALIIVGLIVAVRLALPYVILHYANKTLDEMDGYRGHIKDIDLALIRGAYKIDSIYLNKVDTVSGDETPFLAASVVDLSLEWRALFEGAIVGEVIVENPMVRFTKEKVEPKDVQKDSSDFRQALEELMPLEINRLEFRNGRLQYVDSTTTPKVNISMTDIDVVALNLKNSYDSAAVLPASIDAHATVYDGRLDLSMRLNPLAEIPTFDLTAEWKNTKLLKLNEFFQAYAKLDVNTGTFGLFTEVAAKKGYFTGYVKPLLRDIDVLGKEDRKDNVLRKAWESISGTVSEVFENQSNETFATKIPLEGKLENPEANIFFAILQILENAFINALQPAIDQEISLGSVEQEKQEQEKGLLEKVFDGKGKKDKDDNKDKGDNKDK
jgi:hypothetical protein